MNERSKAGRRFGCLQVLLIVLAAVVLTVAISFLVFRAIYFPSAFRPVTLNAREEQALEAKLERLDFTATNAAAAALEPEPYSEEGAERTIRITEKELNALLAKNTDLADKLAIDLSENLVSAKLLIPLDEDFPVFGGRTLRVKAGLKIRLSGEKPEVVFQGLSVMGIPLPAAWLGGMKDVNLLDEAGGDQDFWKTFAAGIEDLRVEDGRIAIRLRK
ncbi:MAG TPA: arginine N-succinyltransferase [Kiritimatiellia bacterium]|nr:arginine N-succinyltransferase [Kiritimatiellia bacterium]HRZ12827.1 arginine N-succinyltransferase [Kiritimatiellia bacterium]HSA18221.1 arginine N-succinyltransferase [Kiritimatiellia bacterium]